MKIHKCFRKSREDYATEHPKMQFKSINFLNLLPELIMLTKLLAHNIRLS